MSYAAFAARTFSDIRENVFHSTPLEYINNYLASRGAVEYEHVMGVYISSAGAHILNLLNKACSSARRCNFAGHENCSRRHIQSLHPFFMMRSGQLPELRAHVMTIAPTSFSKDYFMNFFGSPDFGFFAKGAFPMFNMGTMTEAAFIGGKVPTRNGAIGTYGVAREHCEAIVMAPEYYAISAEGKVDRSKNFETVLLRALYGGDVDKNLVGVEWHYKTFVTIWGATQPGVRFSLASGIGRRFNFIVIHANDKLESELKNSVLDGVGKSVDWNVIENVRGFFYKLATMNNIPKIVHSSEYEAFRRQLDTILHTDIYMADNIAYGYNLVQYYNDGEALVVHLDDTLRKMIKRLINDRFLATQEGLLNNELVLYPIIEKHQVMTKYALAKRAAYKQRVSFEEAMRTIDQAMKDGTLGFFQRLRKHGGYDTIVYNPSLEESQAKSMWENILEKRGENR